MIAAQLYPARDPAVYELRLTASEWAAMLGNPLKDKRYRASALGALVGRFIRWFRNEQGATPSSVRDYESVLARMSLHLAHLDPQDVTLEHLRDVIDLWAAREPKTRAKVTSVVKTFWQWAEDERHVHESPARRLRRPRLPKKTPSLLPANIDARLLGNAPTARDRLALLILLDCGLRRSELGGVRVRDIDLGRRQLTVLLGKGQKSRVIPLRGRVVLAAEEYLLEPLEFVGRQPEPDDFLLYVEKRNPSGVLYEARPKDPKNGKGVHLWWYRMLERADLVGRGVRSGMNMHRARHSFAQGVRRAYRDMGAVQHLLGHSDPATTISAYGNYEQEDLERAMEAFAKAQREREDV